MKSFFKKQIVDERMELQSLKNARKSWNFVLLASGLSMLTEVFLLNWEFKYVLPQWVVLMAAAMYNLFLDVRDANVYTSEAADRKKVFLLYSVYALIAALLAGYGLYSRTGSVLHGIVQCIATFLLILGMIYLVDSFCCRIAKKRMKKMENTEPEKEEKE